MQTIFFSFHFKPLTLRVVKISDYIYKSGNDHLNQIEK